jgi:PAS domain S-box-containing protein
VSKNPGRAAAATQPSSVVLFPQPALQLIYDTAPIGLACLSPDCRYLQINQRLTEICGLSIEDHLGRSVRDCVPALADAVEDIVRSIMETGEPVVAVEVAGQRPDQTEERFWATYWHPLRSQNGEIVGINVAAEEITERKRAEAVLAANDRALRVSVERQTATADILKVIAGSPSDVRPVFEAIAERSNRLTGGHSTAVVRIIEGMVDLVAYASGNPEADMALRASFPRPVTDYPLLDLIGDGQVLEISDSESELGARTGAREIGRTRGFRSLLLTPLRNETGVIGLISVTRKEPGTFAEHHVQLLRTFADQAVIAIENVRLFDEVQARTGELSLSLEELRATQDRLVQTEQLAALGRLVAGVAHEINTPIGTSLTVASALERKIALITAEFAKNSLKRSGFRNFLEISREASSQLVANLSRAAELIESFKLVATDRNVADQRIFDIGRLTEQVAISLRPALGRKNLTLHVKCQPNLTMNSYPGPYGQVLTNLFLNAVMHAFPDDEEGAIDIRVHASGNEDVEIIVSDGGCGMSNAVRRKAFDPFFTTRRDQGNTGLGLHIVYSIVTNCLGGRLNLDSKLGRGTKIQLLLPRVAPTELERGQ